MTFDKLIAPFQAADGPPPTTLLAFMHWALKGSFGMIAAGSLVSVVSGLIEVASALILGLVIDAALEGSADGFFAENTALILGVLFFFLVFRPAWLGLSGLMQSVVLAPQVYALVLSRLNTHTLGQSVTFFDDDFAGRIAAKQMQAARALTDIVVEFVHTIVFAFASLVGSLVLVLTMDGWSAVALMVWMVAYIGFIRFFMPRIRAASMRRASARAMVTGQIVDTVTNIKTVKLFAHDQHEDDAAVGAIEDFRVAGVGWGWVSATFRFWLGIVGASGAGKSTLVALLLRLYDAEKGAVLIDGQDISAVSQHSLRRQISMVTQETAMFNRSAFENISYGTPDATAEDVTAAAKQAEADAFIQGLEDFKGRKGYDAYLGERGVKLSGGQRQRIAIARAILKDAPILVLDEATSALDSEVEAAIQAALETVMDGKTVIAIAHRLSTLARMDRIIVLDAGQIVEQGSHEDLLAMDGLYARYWNRQSGGFINVKDAAE